jgi:hypothetical protein
MDIETTGRIESDDDITVSAWRSHLPHQGFTAYVTVGRHVRLAAIEGYGYSPAQLAARLHAIANEIETAIAEDAARTTTPPALAAVNG